MQRPDKDHTHAAPSVKSSRKRQTLESLCMLLATKARASERRAAQRSTGKTFSPNHSPRPRADGLLSKGAAPGLPLTGPGAVLPPPAHIPARNTRALLYEAASSTAREAVDRSSEPVLRAATAAYIQTTRAH